MRQRLDGAAFQTVTSVGMAVETDVLIVGGGIAGASLGARLAAHKRVTIIEAEDLCGRHATGRSAAFWQASLGGATAERRLSLASKPMFDAGWPGSDTALLRHRGALHLTWEGRTEFDGADDLPPGYAVNLIDRQELDRLIPALREHWTGAWWEPSCADIEVAAFHAACLAAVRRSGGIVHTDAEFVSAVRGNGEWVAQTAAGELRATVLVNTAGAWADTVARRAGVAPLALEPRRRTVVQLRVDRSGLKDLPFVTDLHESFYFKGEGDRSVWVCPLDETLVDPCDAAPEEIDVAVAIDRFEQAVGWKVEAVERKWAGLRTFAPDRHMLFGFDPEAEGFFWCAGQGGMGIQTAPAASLLCASLIQGEALPVELEGIEPTDFAPDRLRGL
ncbi:NAD(P)/FAD-dependent oxidoreductase [Sphingomonas sp. GCM10030256]|uniref:NAD(P)/FAD-dependent oxidoreductase n=1 Tax=Sphingomonas sp. GCM10030256 TaxID=3273427 RepID=UPI00361F1D86